MTTKTESLEKMIIQFDTLHTELIDYDIKCLHRERVRGMPTELMSGFHTIFYSLRDRVYEILSKEYPAHLDEFTQLCGDNKPILVRDNIQAMALPRKCSSYLKELIENHIN